ncbi:DUF5659 domain-containing protein [Bacillus sp. T33-2]|uniref:DUF5659 domain-containing protein n=1 Tax=Bacillus sp. T33-2 TaxID=2054168 RepID=UPI001C60D056|nr:DUF5659 domain-containing protein [Bacillus sp. T33-2]
MQPSDFFYCYNIQVSEYLKSKGFKFIHIAREPKSNKLYSLYLRTDELNTAIKEYNKTK